MEPPQQLLQPRNPGEALKVAETVLKRRHHDLEGMASRAQKRLKLKKEASQQRRTAGPLTPEKMVKDARVKALDAKRNNQFHAMPKVRFSDEARTLFVLRNMRMPPSRGSKSLGLTRRWAGVLLPNTSVSLLKVRAVEPFVAYGYLHPHIIKDLFLKRLRLRRIPQKQHSDAATDTDDTGQSSATDSDAEDDATQRQDVLASVDNVMIETRLGHLGILCLEDLIDEVRECGPNFPEIMSHVAPFQLQNLKKAEGVDATILESGNIGFKINKKVEKLL